MGAVRLASNAWLLVVGVYLVLNTTASANAVVATNIKARVDIGWRRLRIVTANETTLKGHSAPSKPVLHHSSSSSLHLGKVDDTPPSTPSLREPLHLTSNEVNSSLSSASAKNPHSKHFTRFVFEQNSIHSDVSGKFLGDSVPVNNSNVLFPTGAPQSFLINSIAFFTPDPSSPQTSSRLVPLSKENSTFFKESDLESRDVDVLKHTFFPDALRAEKSNSGSKDALNIERHNINSSLSKAAPTVVGNKQSLDLKSPEDVNAFTTRPLPVSNTTLNGHVDDLEQSEAGAYIPYRKLLKRYGGDERYALVIIIVWSLFLFFLGSRIAEIYFTPAMVRIAAILKFPDSLAGCTLLAFANSSGDLLGGVIAVLYKPEAMPFFMGSIFGASLFLTTVVLGAALWAGSQAVVKLEKASTVRDICFCLFGLSVYLYFALQTGIPSWAPLFLLPLYLLYIGIAVAQSPSSLVAMEHILEDIEPCTSSKDATEAVSDPCNSDERSCLVEGPGCYKSVSANHESLHFNYPTITDVEQHCRATISYFPENCCDSANSFSRWKRLTQTSPDDTSGSTSTTMLLSTRSGKRLIPLLKRLKTREERLSFLKHLSLEPVESLETMSELVPTVPARESFAVAQNNDPLQSRRCMFLRFFFRILLSPFLWVWDLTIPRVGPNVPRMLDYVYPFSIFFFFYVNHPVVGNYLSFEQVGILALVVCGIVYFLDPGPTSNKYCQRVHQHSRKCWCGSFFLKLTLFRRLSPAGLFRTMLSATLALYWNGLLVTEALHCLTFIGEMLGIPSTVVGLTIAAWGNSTADLFANVSVSRSGYTHMALSGVYGSSVMLFLFTSAVVFIVANAKCYLVGHPMLPLRLDRTAIACIVSQIAILALWFLYVVMTIKRMAVRASSGGYLIIGYVGAAIAILLTLKH